MNDTPKADKFAFGFAKPNTGEGVEICHHTNEEWRVFAGELERKAAALDWLQDQYLPGGFWLALQGERDILKFIESAMEKRK